MSTATIETTHEDAALLAGAVTPDNTDEMNTHITDENAGPTIVTTIDRDTTGGLRATATDYIANVTVATEVVATIDQHTNTQS